MTTSSRSDVDAWPETVLRPDSSRRIAEDVREISANLHLAWALARRDLQVRYKQSIIGVGWAVLQPVLTTAVFTLVFSHIAQISSGHVPYPVFLLAGLITWTYFAKVLTEGANSLVNNQGIITKVYFPRLLLPLVPVMAASVDAMIAFVVLLGLLLLYGVAPGPEALAAPAALLAAGLLGYGVALILAPVNALYRDVAVALPFFMQLGMYLTPIVYPASLAPEKLRWLMALNPVATIVELVRASVGGGDWPGPIPALILIAWLALVLVRGFHVFRKLEGTIVDRM